MATDIADSESLKYLTFPYGTVLVEGVYTAKGWLKIRDALDSALPPDATIEPWVLDDSSVPADEADLRAQIRKQYYDEYSAGWMDVPSNSGARRSLLDKCVVNSPTSTSTPSAVKDELMALKGPKGFYRTLFGDFKDNSVGDGPKKSTLLGVQLPFNAEGCGSKVAALQGDGSAPPGRGFSGPEEVSAVSDLRRRPEGRQGRRRGAARKVPERAGEADGGPRGRGERADGRSGYPVCHHPACHRDAAHAVRRAHEEQAPEAPHGAGRDDHHHQAPRGPGEPLQGLEHERLDVLARSAERALALRQESARGRRLPELSRNSFSPARGSSGTSSTSLSRIASTSAATTTC